MTRKDEEIYNKVIKLYDEGRTAQEIVKETGIGSTGTLYRIINKLGIKGRRTKDEFRIVVALPADLREFVESQDNISSLITKLLYSQFEGSSPYSETEGSSDYSQSEGGSDYSETEGGSDYSETEGHEPDTEMPYSETEGEPDIANLSVHYYKDCADVHETTIKSYMHEHLVKALVLGYSQSEGLTDFDEVAVYYGQQLMWLWYPTFVDGVLTNLTL